MLVRTVAVGVAVMIFAQRLLAQATTAPKGPEEVRSLERSFWLHASLAPVAQRGYWGPEFPASAPPGEADIRNAAGVLTGPCAANRLYLIYHQEIPLDQAERTFALWRQYCPKTVQIVPTLVLRMYDKGRTEVFAPKDLQRLVAFFKRTVNPRQLAVYDVYAGRDQGPSLTYLAGQYPGGLIRVGIQPEEGIGPPFVAAVQDTWGGLCHGKTNADWVAPGFGAQTLRQWVQDRNRKKEPVAWDLVVVAWDYGATERGGYPGYDDAARNMPLPAGRNQLAAEEILRTAQRACLRGFSSDLLILQANSQAPARDGVKASFYETLKRGQPYRGYFARPFQEIADIYNRLRKEAEARSPSTRAGDAKDSPGASQTRGARPRRTAELPAP